MKRIYQIVRFSNNNRGFTMIEIIAVLIIIGIISAVAMSKVSSTQSESLAVEADILRGHLRYAQFRALSDSVTWGIRFTSDSYSLLYDKAPTDSKLFPNDNSSTHTLQGVMISTGAGDDVNFNDWGIPLDATGAKLTSNKDIVLTSGTSTQTITITMNTGYIP